MHLIISKNSIQCGIVASCCHYLNLKLFCVPFIRKKFQHCSTKAKKKKYMLKSVLSALMWTLFTPVLRRPLLMSSSAFLRTWVLFNRNHFQFPLTLWSIQFSLPSFLLGPPPRLHLHRGAQLTTSSSGFTIPSVLTARLCYRKIANSRQQPLRDHSTYASDLMFHTGLLSQSSVSFHLFSSVPLMALPWATPPSHPKRAALSPLRNTLSCSLHKSSVTSTNS